MNRPVSLKSPWWWIPTLYFAEGIPYFIVNNISVTMFTKMGSAQRPDGALYQPALSAVDIETALESDCGPVQDQEMVDNNDADIDVGVICPAHLQYPRPSDEMIASVGVPISMFTMTLILFVITAFASATHDISADGFYMIALDHGQQSFFVGIRSTFYRLSSIFGQGVLVVIAGILEERTGNIPTAWMITMAVTAVMFTLITLYHTFTIPSPSSDKAAVRQPAHLQAVLPRRSCHSSRSRASG